LARLGLRAGEIVALQLEDVDWVNAQLTVRSKKGDGWARLPLANRRRASPGSLLASKATNFIPKRLRSGIRPPYAVRSLWSRFGFGKNGD
jgi:integrase